MSFYSSDLYKRTSSLRASKQSKLPCKTPKGSASFSVDLYNPKKNNEKLNLSNILNVSDVTATVSVPNTNSSFNQATLSSAAKLKSRNTPETATHEIFYLRPTPRQSSGRLDFQKILFPDKKIQREVDFEQTKEAESGLWDSPRSIANKNERDYSLNQEQANQESSNKIKNENNLKKISMLGMINCGSNDYGTIKRLKEIIHKLQLKDAIQRQEITKLKRMNEKISKDSKILEDKVHSLERIRNNEDYLQSKIPLKCSEKRRNSSEKSYRQARGDDTKLSNKSMALMQQVERIASEKLKLEETFKNSLFDREFSKGNIPLSEIEYSPKNEKIDQFESNDSVSISDSILRANYHVSQIQLKTPNSVLKHQHPIQTNDQLVEKKLSKLAIQSSREDSPTTKIFLQASGPSSQRSRRVSPIDLIFNSKSELKKDQVSMIVSNRNSPMTNRNTSHRDYNPSPRVDRKGERKLDNLSVDYNPQRQKIPELNSTEQIDSVSHVYEFPLRKDIQSKEISEKVINNNDSSYLSQKRDQILTGKNVNVSSLNNVSPAVIDIISQYKHKQVKASLKNSSVSNCSKNESYSAKLNLEQLFASNGKEKENNKKNEKKETDATTLMQITNSENMPCQEQKSFRRDSSTFPRQFVDLGDNKKQENFDYAPEEKVQRKDPLDELKFTQRSIGCMPFSNLSQGAINSNFYVMPQVNELSLTPGVCPIVLSAQPQGRIISSKRAQMALETLRAKMNKREEAQ